MGALILDNLPAKVIEAWSDQQWLRMHQPLALLSPPAEAIYQGVVTVIPNGFFGARSDMSAG